MTNVNPSDFNRSGLDSNDDLDALLRQWHQTNTARAAAMRDELLAKLAVDAPASRHVISLDGHAGTPDGAAAPRIATSDADPRGTKASSWWRMDLAAVLRHSRVAAALVVLAALVVAFLPLPGKHSSAAACDIVMAPDAGRLDAFDGDGNLIGPCPLAHTDVVADVSAHVTRVTIDQTYHNRYDTKVEAVYTFPMSHRAAVDRMTMTIKPPGGGERVVVGEVKERELARQIYEAARDQGYVASLLEQERPNIFTQSIANIEPGANVIVQISYVETLMARDGQYTFDFPMVVGPRYIPGTPTMTHAQVPQGLQPRRGVVLLGPAQMTIRQQHDTTAHGALQAGKMEALLTSARAIAAPTQEWWLEAGAKPQAAVPDDAPIRNLGPALWAEFQADYCDGAAEYGQLFVNGTGHVNGRWFYCDPASIKDMGTGFEPDPNQVPDASRITPMPVNPARPPHRAGHDISLTVNIDTGGPAILDVASELHEIKDEVRARNGFEPASRRSFTLKNDGEIPNRDFILSWRTSADSIQEATLAHTDHRGKFFTLILNPPARVDDAAATPRELVFVMDTSGSMRGFPIEKSKAVMTRAIDSMRVNDTFNVITFSGSTAILWPQPRPATQANKAEAQAFIAGQQGRGGTEMMKAIEAALVQQPRAIDPAGRPHAITPLDLANLPADGRLVAVSLGYDIWTRFNDQTPVLDVPVRDGVVIKVRRAWRNIDGRIDCPVGESVVASGTWSTVDGQRVFIAQSSRWAISMPAMANPLRLALFFTDGYVGNDMAIIDAVRKNARTTRVFSFGIGDSVNRYLLDSMAQAGRGEVEYVSLESNADEAVARFTKRIQTPVLTDIQLAFSDGLRVTDTIPPLDAVPDLFDVKPLIIHGRYTQPGQGTLTIRGQTGAGAYERVLPLDLPAHEPQHDVIATLWARAKVEQAMNSDLKAAQEQNISPDVRQQIVALGEQFSILTQYTSFVAVEKSRLTIGGQPMLVAVPIELPAGTDWTGFFGGESFRGIADFNGDGDGFDDVRLGVPLARSHQGASTGDALVDHVGLREGSAGMHALTVRATPVPVDWSKVGEPVTTTGTGSSMPQRGNDSLHMHSGTPAVTRYLFKAGDVGSAALGKRTAGLAGQPGGMRRVESQWTRDQAPVSTTASPSVNLGVPMTAVPPPPKPSATPSGGGFGGGGGSQNESGIFGAGRRLRVESAGAPVSPSEEGRTSGVSESARQSTIDKKQMDQDRANAAGIDELSSQIADFIKEKGIAGSDDPRVVEAQADARREQAAQTAALTISEAEAQALSGAVPEAPGDMPLLGQHIVLVVDHHVLGGELDKARRLARWLTEIQPGFAMAATIHQALNDEKLGDEQKRAAVAEQAKLAREQIAEIVKQARLRRALTPELLALAQRESSRGGEPPMLVTVLVQAVDSPTRKALTKAGLAIEDSSPSPPLVVGRVHAADLERVALLDGVRRVEMTR